MSKTGPRITSPKGFVLSLSNIPEDREVLPAPRKVSPPKEYTFMFFDDIINPECLKEFFQRKNQNLPLFYYYVLFFFFSLNADDSIRIKKNIENIDNYLKLLNSKKYEKLNKNKEIKKSYIILIKEIDNLCNSNEWKLFVQKNPRDPLIKFIREMIIDANSFVFSS